MQPLRFNWLLSRRYVSAGYLSELPATYLVKASYFFQIRPQKCIVRIGWIAIQELGGLDCLTSTTRLSGNFDRRYYLVLTALWGRSKNIFSKRSVFQRPTRNGTPNDLYSWKHENLLFLRNGNIQNGLRSSRIYCALIGEFLFPRSFRRVGPDHPNKYCVRTRDIKAVDWNLPFCCFNSLNFWINTFRYWWLNRWILMGRIIRVSLLHMEISFSENRRTLHHAPQLWLTRENDSGRVRCDSYSDLLLVFFVSLTGIDILLRRCWIILREKWRCCSKMCPSLASYSNTRANGAYMTLSPDLFRFP